MICATPLLAKTPTRQASLDEWRELTSATAPAPAVFIKGRNAVFLFETATNEVAFKGTWSGFRIPSNRYRVRSALLKWQENRQIKTPPDRSWRRARVIAGAEWKTFSTNLITALAPKQSGHGVCYQGFFSDRVLFRASDGRAGISAEGQEPPNIIIDHRYTLEETLETVALVVDESLGRSNSSDSALVFMAPHSEKFTETLLLDRQQRQCVVLFPAAAYDTTEKGFSVATTARGFEALLIEGHGLALLKNPVSSLTRLADLGMQTTLLFLRLPLPRAKSELAPLNPQGV